MKVFKLPSTPLNELFDIASAFAAICGTGLLVAWAVKYGLSIIAVPSSAALIASGFVLLATVGVLFFSIEARPGIANAVLRWRYIAALVIAGVIGYELQAYQYSHSDEAQSRKAALWACAKIPECRSSAEKYGELTSTYVYIPPVQK